MIAHIIDTVLSLAAGFGLRWYLTKDLIVSRANLQKIITWLESTTVKSEVSIRNEAALLLSELKTKL